MARMTVDTARSLVTGTRMLLAAPIVLAFLSAPAAAEQTRHYVMSKFWHAANNAADDCPGGINPKFPELVPINLANLGYSAREIAAILERDAARDDSGGWETDELTQILFYRARINGKPANAYMHPLAVKDPGLKPWGGKMAYGFDLDGKGETPTSFTDPESGLKGVKHELARVYGCNDQFRARLRDGSAAGLFFWMAIKDAAPAWTISVTGEDLDKDGPVTIRFSRAMEPVRYNGNGSARADMSYRADPDPRTANNVYAGEIKDGVISVTEPGPFFMVQEPLLFPLFTMHQFQARMKMNASGVLEVLIGGYQPIDEIYHFCGSANMEAEKNFCAEPPGIYHLLVRHADYDRDPATGRNRAISSTYYLEAVPAYLEPANAGVGAGGNQ